MSTETVVDTPAPMPVTGPSRVLRPRLVIAELRKIFSTSTWWVFGLLGFAFTGLALLFSISSVDSEVRAAEQLIVQGPPNFDLYPPEARPPASIQLEQLEQYRAATDIPAIVANGAAEVYTSGQFFGLLLVAILGALVVTNEFTHQTATATFLTTPQRTRVIIAKLVAGVLLAAGYWAFATLFSLGVGGLNFASLGQGAALTDQTVLRAMGMNLLAYVVWAVVGIGLGVLIRSQLGATMTVSFLYLGGWPALLVFSLLSQLVGDWVYNLIVLMPGIASMIMVQTERLQLGFNTFGPEWYVGAGALVAYGVIAGVIGTVVMRRRDIS